NFIPPRARNLIISPGPLIILIKRNQLHNSFRFFFHLLPVIDITALAYLLPDRQGGLTVPAEANGVIPSETDTIELAGMAHPVVQGGGSHFVVMVDETSRIGFHVSLVSRS